MLVSHRAAGSNVNQLFLLAAPGACSAAPDRFPGADQRRFVRSSRWPLHHLFARHRRQRGGTHLSARPRLSRASTLLSDPEKRSSASWNEAGTRLLIASVPLDRTAQGGRRDQIGATLTLIDPLKPEERRVIAELPGTGWFDFTFSPDDKWLAMIRYISRTETEVWRMDVASGKRERLLPATDDAARATYFGLEFSPDGSRLYLTTTARSEFQQLAEYRFKYARVALLSIGHCMGRQEHGVVARWPSAGRGVQCRRPRRIAIVRSSKRQGACAAEGSRRSNFRSNVAREARRRTSVHSEFTAKPRDDFQRRYHERSRTALDHRGHRRSGPCQLSRR